MSYGTSKNATSSLGSSNWATRSRDLCVISVAGALTSYAASRRPPGRWRHAPCSHAPACNGGARPTRFSVGADTGRSDQGRVHQRGRAHQVAAGIQLARHRLEQGPVQTTTHPLGTKAHEGGAFRRGSWAANPQNRRKLARSSSASASRTSERSCHIANSSARNSASGGQLGSPLCDAALSRFVFPPAECSTTWCTSASFHATGAPQTAHVLLDRNYSISRSSSPNLRCGSLGCSGPRNSNVFSISNA